MMVFTAMQTGVPTITAPQIVLATGILGFFILIFKLGSVWGDLNRNVSTSAVQNSKDAAALREELHRGFEKVDAALTRFTDAMTGLSSLVTALSVTVKHHDDMLKRSLTGPHE